MKRILSIIAVFVLSLSWAHNHLPLTQGELAPALSQFEFSDEKVVVTPNPASTVTYVKITSETAKVVEISVYSLLGNQVFAKAYDNETNSIQLNVQNFKKGKYLVKVVFSDGTSEVKSLIKQ